MNASFSDADLQDAIAAVNEYFKFTDKQKVSFRLIDDPYLFKSEPGLIHLLLFIFKNFVIFAHDAKGCSVLAHLCSVIREMYISFVNLYDEQHFGRWSYNMYTYLKNFFTTLSMKEGPWRRNIDNFYSMRNTLYELLILFVDGTEISTIKNYARTLKKMRTWFPKLRFWIVYLADPLLFDMEQDIRDDYYLWLESVASFYLIECRIFNNDISELSQEQKNDIPLYSIILSKVSNTQKRIAYHIGIFTDDINVSYSQILSNPLPRSKIGHEYKYLVDLCSLLMKDIMKFSTLHARWNVNEKLLRKKEEITNSFYYTLKKVLSLNSVPQEIVQMIGILSKIIEMFRIQLLFFLKTQLISEVEANLILQDSMEIRCIDKACDRLFDGMQELMETLVVYDKTDPGRAEERVSAILPVLPRLRQTFFPAVISYCQQLPNIYYFPPQTIIKIEKFIGTTLLELSKKAQDFKDPPLMQNTTSKKALGLARLLLKKAIMEDE